MTDDDSIGLTPSNCTRRSSTRSVRRGLDALAQAGTRRRHHQVRAPQGARAHRARPDRGLGTVASALRPDSRAHSTPFVSTASKLVEMSGEAGSSAIDSVLYAEELGVPDLGGEPLPRLHRASSPVNTTPVGQCSRFAARSRSAVDAPYRPGTCSRQLPWTVECSIAGVPGNRRGRGAHASPPVDEISERP
jgi:hypothetical protein